MEFCPSCSMLLQYGLPYLDRPGRLFCPTCPYICNIQVKIERKQLLTKKHLDPIISQQEEAKLAPETEDDDDDDVCLRTTVKVMGFRCNICLNMSQEATCPRCNFKKAAFEQRQTRGADEPMTIFYECRSCAHKWKED